MMATLGRDDLVARPLLRAVGDGHGRGLELGDVLPDGIAEQDLPFLEQDHDGDARHGLGLRGDAEDGVGRHGRARRRIELADGLEMSDLAVAGDERHGPAEPALIDVLLHDFADPGQPVRRQPNHLRPDLRKIGRKYGQ